MSKPTVNGEISFSSQFLSHIGNYPLVAQSIDFYKSRPLGAKSLELANSAFENFGKPVLPYLQTPISIVSPYAKGLDQIGDDTLNHVDQRIPAVKNTGYNELYDGATSVALYPLKLAGQGRDYVYRTYGNERKNTPEGGLIGTGKAFISTELRIASDGLHAVADYLGPKKDQLQEQIQKLKGQGKDKAQDLQSQGQNAANDLGKKADHQKKQAHQAVQNHTG